MEKQNLEDCYVSEEHGFILRDPLDKLPDYYKPWMDIAECLSVLIETKKLRDEVSKMPELGTQQLKGHRQQRLARTILSHIVMGYVWQNGESGGVKVLPRALAVPYHQLSHALGLPLIIVHADFVLANWKKKDPLGPLTIENLSTIVSLPGGDSLQGFVLVTLLVEAAAIPAVKAVIQAVKSLESDDKQRLLIALQDLERSINQMSEALHLMYDYVDSDVYYNTIRIYLSGWKDNPNMPEGLIYEGVSEEPLHFSGGSAGQSTIFHAFDELLGIQHKPNSLDFLLKMRDYMPPAHRGFIRWVQEAPKLPEYVQRSNDPALLSVFNQCISALTEIRSLHIRIVSKYVNAAGIRARMKTNQAVTEGQEPQERGTGGSQVMSFLKSVRDTCKEGTLRHSIPGDH
ncbi:PREDICTED: indoleamine 2,3-dioxygenase 2 [Nanorana parkeri]|uniref:indoleamine 2,3-dioxygenase 2 n=1 Tax=Nanorana parkeri TaxID=125878 RepID=UPI0008541CCF|nr:PREDICTED: indoleamine 2,3-dioxygenase 2 [Nanorana parkeri]